MFLINKGQANNIFLTLTEKATISSPTYLFEFKNDITRATKVFLTQDLSSNTDRYNKFTILETSGTNDLTAGIITLVETGFYSYRIFEQASTTNLDLRLTGAEVECGKFKVVSTVTSKPTYDNQPKRFVTYG